MFGFMKKASREATVPTAMSRIAFLVAEIEAMEEDMNSGRYFDEEDERDLRAMKAELRQLTAKS